MSQRVTLIRNEFDTGAVRDVEAHLLVSRRAARAVGKYRDYKADGDRSQEFVGHDAIDPTFRVGIGGSESGQRSARVS